MSAPEDYDPSPQNRRLRLRNSLVRPSRLSYGPSGADDSPPRAPSPSPQIDDNGWETEDADSTTTTTTTPTPPPPPPPPQLPFDEENVSNSARKRRSRDASFFPPALMGLSPAASGASGLKPPFPGVNHRRNRSGSEGGQRGDRYVDYLERQVADLSAQLQGYTSPTSGTSHAAKLRRLSSEARSLHNEVLDWEAKFNVRVKAEVELKVAQDNTLRGKIRVLEEKLDEALERGREVEEECDAWHRRAAELESVNRALEVRVEALGSMLAEATRGERGVSRSRSRVGRSRCGSEVGGAVGMERCVTIGTATETGATTTPAESRRGSVDGGETTMSPGSSPGRRLEDYGITDPIDAVLLTMTSSSSPPPPGEPLRTRRMRRFPSGSTAPKALVLPPSSSPSSSPSTPAPETSPTLPTLRAFFGVPVADPSSMCSSRPSTSSSSDAPALQQPSAARPPLASSDSLFAELARAENESVADETLPSDDTFTLVSDAMNNPTPLLIKAVTMVGAGIRSPTGTFLTARKTAMDMLTGVVGKGVERVSRRRAKLLQYKSREARRRIEGVAEDRDRVRRCACTDHGGSSGGSSSGVSVALTRGASGEDTVEHVWLWVRFVVALVVALGVAVKEGPAVVLAVDGGDYDGVVEEERESAIRELRETRAERMRREWRGMGDERLRLWESGGRGGVHVGDGRKKAMEWGV
ncbi:hypothetical protein DFP73DRAFT_629139 [Morchella snyderi]|nr:hypothetical protein DFP73DRAFT_629139 [Morchella snyderi]